MQPPRLKNDCFALPPGVDWTPVDVALDRLRSRLHAVTPTTKLRTVDASGCYLAQDVIAERSNPPAPNSAVDGYGFAHGSTGNDVQILPLVAGRAAAGAAFHESVPPGHAIRILTGAILPDGVDTVVLEEDTTVEADRIAFRGPVKPGSNTRKAGEDISAGAVVLSAGTRLGAAEIAILTATGVSDVVVHQALRIGVLSTGDELVDAGQSVDATHIYDANRPMLLALLERWGYRGVDLGHAHDDRKEIRQCLHAAIHKTDVILTSGGASAGDEDHISALLSEVGAMDTWRIALKPGRPLALGIWNGVPVFGLPGNPVAAYVCTLIFAEPAFRVMAGGTWRQLTGFDVPAAFNKSKKPGRREYLRARLNADGAAEVFASEGSGRISGLAWADGLVEIEDGAREIGHGDIVRYIPFTSFGT